MVATRAQRAQTKDEPAPPKRGALKEPARRGRKKAEPEEPAPEPKPARAAATKKAAKAAAPAAKSAAPATRRTRAKDADAPALEEPVEAPETADEPEEQQEEPAPRAPARATRKAATTKATTTKAATTKAAATKAAPKPAAATTRKRSAKDVDPEPAPPAKRQTRTRATAEPEEPAEDAAMEEPEEAPVAKRTTRATRGTKASETRSAAAVKPLAQRITVTAKKPTKKAKKEEQPEPEPEEANTADVEMEDAEEPPAPAPAKSIKKSSRKAAKDPAESERESSEAPVEPTPAKPAKKTSKKPVLEEVPEAPAQETEINDEPAPATLIKSTNSSRKGANKEEEQTVQTETAPEPAEEAQEHPAAATPTKASDEAQERSATPERRSPTPEPTEEEESKENIPPPATPGPAHYAEALPFAATATPFFKFGQTPKTTSLQARTPGLNKSSLFHETPRKAPIVSPFKLAPMSAAKPAHQDGSVLNSPPKRAPIGTSMPGMTPMRASTAKPDFKSSMLHTPAKKGLMLPPSTAPVNKNGFQPAQAKSSLLQTCPRRIALPGLPPKSSATSPTKPAEGNMGSSLLSATPRRVRIESPAKPAFGTSVHDFADNGEEPKRWKTPVKTPARRFATPGMTPAKSLVDADAGSPTPVKQTPAGLKDVNSALKLLNEASPAMHPTTPTEQFMLNVIEKLDQSMSDESEEAQEVSRLNDEVEVARSAEQPEEQDEQDDITEGLDIQQSVSEEMEQCVSPADLVMSDNESPVETPAPQTPAAQKPAPQFSVPQTPAAQTSPFHIAVKESDDDVVMNEQSTTPEAPVQQPVFEEQQFEDQQTTVEEVTQPIVEMEVIAEEPSVLEQHVEEPEAAQLAPEIEFIETYEEEKVVEEHELSEPVVESAPAVEQQTEEKPVLEEQTVEENIVEEKIVEEQEVQAPVMIQAPERPSTPTADEQHIAALAREKAKTERRARHKRLSMAIELESSIKKPRKSLAFIPSLTPAKSALRSPFKKPFGSPKKSVAWAAEAPVPRIIEEYRQPEVVQAAVEFEINIPRPDDQLLGGAVFFVDVRTAEGEDASDLFVPLLEEMGAKIVDSWTGVDAAVTHVLYKDGVVETLEKVAATNGTVKAVNIAWVLDCERFNKWVPEGDYLIDLACLGSNSPARALTTLSANTTPARPTPAKSAYGTPFALLHMTPKSKPSLSPFADINSTTTPNKSPMENKENTTPVSQQQQPSLFKTPTKAAPAIDMDFTPSTPYFMHAHNIIQKTCPPKQSNRGLFDQGAPSESAFAVTPFRQKMLLARRSLSPAAFGRAMDM